MGTAEKPHNAIIERINDKTLWDEVRISYQENTTTRDPALIKEIEIVKEAMQHFDSTKGSRYIVDGFLGVGGVGIVFRVWDKLLLTHRALKVARPIEGKENLVIGLLSEEISRLQEVNHPNLISIFDVGNIKSSASELPFYTMTFLRGALNAKKFFSQPRSNKELFSFISGFLSGIKHLHSAKLIHLDLKPSNVFVGEDGFSVIGDLGGARKIEGDLEEELTITCTSGYAHPDLLALTAVSSGGEDNRRRGQVKRRFIKFEFDRYAIGKSIFEIINLFDSLSPQQLSQYQRKYILLQAARSLDGKTQPEERPLGLTEDSLNRIKYNSIEEIWMDFNKLTGQLNLINQIPELSPSNDSVIQVSRGSMTKLTPRLERLLKEPLLRRLGTISQLGLVRLIYPCATHTRLEHSLGTYSNAVDYITALYYDPINPLFRQIMSEDDLVSVILSALLHDLGQYQHAHDLTNVEPNIFNHETLTVSLLKGQYTDYKLLYTSLHKQITDNWKVKPERIVSILEANPNNLSSNIKDRILHSIISGPLDVDKLDYLIRDSDYCQTAFGNGLDKSRLLSTLTIVYHRKGAGDNQYFALGIHEKGRAAAESLGFIRFQMFRSVYWHHSVRSAKSMLQRAAFEWIAKDGYDTSKNGKLKNVLHNFILQSSEWYKDESKKQPNLFDEPPKLVPIGYSVYPQWSNISNTDMRALQWLHSQTTEIGQGLIESIARRDLYKRVFVISATQDAELWKLIQDDLKTYYIIKQRSEELRIALKTKIDSILQEQKKGNEKIYVTGIGEDTDHIIAASRILGREGTVLLDKPISRGKEDLLFYPEDLHRGQREEFQAPSLLAVSELWNLVSTKLHETAGNIRVFVHPEIDVLRKAKIKDGTRLLNSHTIEEELRNLFKS